MWLGYDRQPVGANFALGYSKFEEFKKFSWVLKVGINSINPVLFVGVTNSIWSTKAGTLPLTLIYSLTIDEIMHCLDKEIPSSMITGLLMVTGLPCERHTLTFLGFWAECYFFRENILLENWNIILSMKVLHQSFISQHFIESQRLVQLWLVSKLWPLRTLDLRTCHLSEFLIVNCSSVMSYAHMVDQKLNLRPKPNDKNQSKF